MWLIFEECGIACAIMTYFIVILVYFTVVRIGIWEEILEGSLWAFVHFAVFQYHCFMIFYSHFKCMTTNPGTISKEIDIL